METHLIKKMRLLVVSLILSCGLNIGLLFALIFSALQSRQGIPPAAELVQRTESLKSTPYRQDLAAMSKLSFAELVAQLTNREVVEEGLAKRDLALAALVSFHYFHIEKALGSLPAQRRQAALSSDQVICLYPGVDDEQFEAIIRFAYRERWPLTAKGLFGLLKKRPAAEREESLLHAFFSTDVFYSLQLLFQKTEAPQPSKTLLTLACEGPWELLEQLALEQSQKLDLSVDKRRHLLLSYIAQNSPMAAHLLLQTDFAFARQKLEDGLILQILPLLQEKTAEAERFCTELLLAPRTDLIWRAASERLYAFAKEEIPESFELKTALARFVPDAKPAMPPLPAPSRRQHIVKEGENLWKIARQYKVTVDALARANELQKDQLYPEMILIIP
jgi:hypothetical protein